MHRCQEDGVQVNDHQVSLAAHADHAGLILGAECLGATTTGHLDAFARQQRHGIEVMHLLQQHGGLQDFEHVLTVVASWTVAGQGHVDVAAAHVENARHTRRQEHIAHRAAHDRGAGFGDQVQLVVVEPHAVGKLHVGSQEPKFVEPFDVASAAFFDVQSHFFFGLGDMDVGAGTPLAGFGDGFFHGVVGATPRQERCDLDPDAVVVAPMPTITQSRCVRQHLLGGLLHLRRIVPVSPTSGQHVTDARVVG